MPIQQFSAISLQEQKMKIYPKNTI